jgi:hypothetical protein
MDDSTALTSASFLTDGIRRLIATKTGDPFVIYINDHEYSVSLIEAILLSPRITAEVQTDLTMRQFRIHDNRIDAKYFLTLVNLVRNESVTIVHSSRRSLILISRYLGNAFLESFFFNLRFESISSELFIHPI